MDAAGAGGKAPAVRTVRSTLSGTLDRLRSLEIFVRVAEARSFVEAARGLGLTASATGKSVARLEEELDVRLLQRTTHAVSLTSEGALLLVRSRRMLAEYEAATAELAGPAAGVRGVLRVGAPAWATMLTRVFGRYADLHPAVRLEIDFDDDLVDVVGDRYDVVFRTGELRDSTLVRRRVGRYRHAIVASAAYLARSGTPRSSAELLDHRCVHRRRPDGTVDPWPLDHPVDAPASSMLMNTVDGRIELALAGFGIVCVPAPAVAEHLRGKRLVSLLESALRHPGKLHAVWAPGKKTSPPLRALLALLDEVPVPGLSPTG